MTRTERASFPRALVRDRSQSKSGLDSSLRKGGGGYHNWGSIADEGYLEAAAWEDGARELAEESKSNDSGDKGKPPKPAIGRTSSLSEEDVEQAKQIRKNALKAQDIDLSTIARTSSAVSSSPPLRGRETSVTDTSSVTSA
ncbi:hypothetical protein ID866_2065 [Astraeus odoratus]|nr:hypothetical protein ID866_2065 [Astraeus odoratus]